MKNIAPLLLLALAGCVNVPKTEISGSLGGRPFVFRGPKDVSLGSLVVTADTTGAVSLTVTALQTRMNPDVITTTGAAQAAMIKEVLAGAAAVAGSVPK